MELPPIGSAGFVEALNTPERVYYYLFLNKFVASNLQKTNLL